MTKNEQALEIIAEEMIKANEHRDKKRTRFERCTVVAVSNGTCTIRYNNFEYDKTRILNNIPLKVNDKVIVVIPDGKLKNRFVLGTI